MPIPAHQVFEALSAFNDLVAEFFRLDVHTSSSGHLEGFEGISGR
jgi:hypothetical protein